MGDKARAGDQATSAGAETVTRRFSERLYLAWWGWPLPLIAAGLLAAEIHMGYPGLRAWLPYVVLLPLAVILLIMLGRAKVEVTTDPDGTAELMAGQARLPSRHIGAVEVIERENKRRALGPDLDPAAFVLHRGWIGTAVRVQLTDPADPTPYWVLSTRRPHALATALGDQS